MMHDEAKLRDRRGPRVNKERRELVRKHLERVERYRKWMAEMILAALQTPVGTEGSNG